jgi:Protocatechuate 3,4-dioxygenase beta subunit N terminal
MEPTGSFDPLDLAQSEFIARDRSVHPPALTPDYKTSVLRSPRLPLKARPRPPAPMSISGHSAQAGFDIFERNFSNVLFADGTQG